MENTMNSICRFIPAKTVNEGLETVYFVYETEFHKLKQPFQHATFFLQLVTRGNAQLVLDGHTYHLRRGTLVMIPPAAKYIVEGDADFAYICCQKVFEYCMTERACTACDKKGFTFEY